jgi:hypothetical protein
LEVTFLLSSQRLKGRNAPLGLDYLADLSNCWFLPAPGLVHASLRGPKRAFACSWKVTFLLIAREELDNGATEPGFQRGVAI